LINLNQGGFIMELSDKFVNTKQEALSFLEMYQKQKGYEPKRLLNPEVKPSNTLLNITHLREFPVQELSRGWVDSRLISFANDLIYFEYYNKVVHSKESIAMKDYKTRLDIALIWDKLYKDFLMGRRKVKDINFVVREVIVMEASLGIYIVKGLSVEDDIPVDLYLCSRYPIREWHNLLDRLHKSVGVVRICMIYGMDRSFIVDIS
jgi:hypothetical protein